MNTEGGAATAWRWLLPVWLVLLGGVVGFGPPSFGEGEVWGERFSSPELGALTQAPGVPRGLRPAALVVTDAGTGHALLAANADARLAPASLTKMMTALVALDHAQLTDVITASLRSMAEPTVIGLDPGEQLSLEDMLYGMLLASGNDAALAIAETVSGGSIERFIGWMNDRARQMGLRNTHFANPTGLDEPDHYSSARDLARIAAAVMDEPRLARIAGSSRHAVVGGPYPYLFQNSNPLLGLESGVDGVKTGFTDDAGRCLVVSVSRDGHRLITVVLNSPDPASETRTMIQSTFTAARWVNLELARPGLSSVHIASAGGGPGSVALAGWEPALLRGFQTTEPRFWIGAATLSSEPR